MLLLPVLQECFATSRRKQDFELRIEQLQLQLQDVANEMQTLIAQLRRNLLLHWTELTRFPCVVFMPTALCNWYGNSTRYAARFGVMAGMVPCRC